MKRQVTDQLRGAFRPEFLNRIDEIIVFHALTDAELVAIADLQVAELQRRIAATDLVLELTPAARQLIVREGTDPAFGARPLKRTIQRMVEKTFARAMLSGTFKAGDTVVADADPVSGTLVFSGQSGTVVREASAGRPSPADPKRHRGVRPRPAFDLPPSRNGRGHGRRLRTSTTRCSSMRSSVGSLRCPRCCPRPGGADSSARRDRGRGSRRAGHRHGIEPSGAVLVLLFPGRGRRGAIRAHRARGSRWHHSAKSRFRLSPETVTRTWAPPRPAEAAEEVGLARRRRGCGLLGSPRASDPVSTSP